MSVRADLAAARREYGYPQKECYPKKMIKKKLATQKFWRTLLRGGLLLRSGKMAYFIVGGFINAIRTLHFSVSEIFRNLSLCFKQIQALLLSKPLKNTRPRTSSYFFYNAFYSSAQSLPSDPMLCGYRRCKAQAHIFATIETPLPALRAAQRQKAKPKVYVEKGD